MSAVAVHDHDERKVVAGRTAAFGRPVPVVCFPFVNDSFGGSYISALNLVFQLDQQRFQPLIVLPNGGGEIVEYVRGAGFDFEVADARSSGAGRGRGHFGGLSRIAASTRFLRERGVAIVHTNDSSSHLAWGPAARAAGARLVWHHRHGPKARALRYLAPWLASRVVSVSRFAVPETRITRLADRCTVIHSPFDTSIATTNRSAARRTLLAELGCHEETRFVGYFGTFIQRKRPLLFVDTIASLVRRNPSLRVMGLFFGRALEEGADEAILRHAAAKGISEYIRLMGFRYPPEPWLAACDVLLVTAVDEPFGRTLVEAMLVGTPVVAADSGGNPEAIQHDVTGLLVPPDDPVALAAALAGLFDNRPRAASLARAARDDALSRFSLAAHAEKIMAVYDDLLRGRQ